MRLSAVYIVHYSLNEKHTIEFGSVSKIIKSVWRVYFVSSSRLYTVDVALITRWHSQKWRDFRQLWILRVQIIMLWLRLVSFLFWYFHFDSVFVQFMIKLLSKFIVSHVGTSDACELVIIFNIFMKTSLDHPFSRIKSIWPVGTGMGTCIN